MNSSTPTSPHIDDLDNVVERWRAAAHAGGWRALGDWNAAAVAAVAAAASSGRDDDDAASRLGRARGIAGVGIAEGLDDLDRLWVVLGDVGAPTRATRAFAQGWADAVAAPASRPALDPSSGLATTAVLQIRLRDLERTNGATGAALVVVDVVDAALPRFARHLEVAGVGALLVDSFPSAESPVRLPNDRVAALVPRDGALDEGVIRLRRALERRWSGRGEAAVIITALPGAAETLDDWLTAR